MFERPTYINAIAPFVDKPLVKILAGVRRSGKSTILLLLRDELLRRGISPDNIIARNYSDIRYESMTASEMHSDIVAAMQGKGHCYLLLDELQEIDGWERSVNTLLESADVDIYVTGSNSKLMSAEISTYLTGRYVLLPVYTLSFAEYLTFRGKTNADAASVFTDYLQYGGFPVIAASDFDRHSAYQIVDGIYSTVITNDIARRHDIRNQELFDRVVRYIVENVGKTFSANNVVAFLKGERRSVSVEAIYNYIKWLAEAFIVYPCKRFDLQGKQVLKTQEKYYLSDVSLRYAKAGFDGKMVSAMLENIVYLEMKRRGYDVYVGKLGDKEIDFVATRGNNRIYVQVCRNLPDDSSRETENLAKLNDNYHKYVVTADGLSVGNDNGIEIVHIADFLLRSEW